MKILVTILTIILVITTGCNEKKKISPKIIRSVKILDLKKVDSTVKLSFPGIVRAAKRAELSFDVSGRIIFLDANEGKKVKKGEIIARLDDRNYKNNYLAAKAVLKDLELTRKRFIDLFQKKSIAKSKLDQVESNYEAALAHMKIAEKAFKDCYLKSFFSGVIVKRYVEEFQNVMMKEPIVSIENRDTLEVIINVPESIVINTKLKDIISITSSFDAIPNKKFPLLIKEMAGKASPNTRTYEIVCSMLSLKNYNILTGMTAKVDVVIKNKEYHNKEFFLVPLLSVTTDKDNNSYIWFYSEKTSKVSKQKVTIGKIINNNIEILSKIDFNKKIVTSGVNYLVDGMSVRPITHELEK